MGENCDVHTKIFQKQAQRLGESPEALAQQTPSPPFLQRGASPLEKLAALLATIFENLPTSSPSSRVLEKEILAQHWLRIPTVSPSAISEEVCWSR